MLTTVLSDFQNYWFNVKSFFVIFLSSFVSEFSIYRQTANRRKIWNFISFCVFRVIISDQFEWRFIFHIWLLKCYFKMCSAFQKWSEKHFKIVVKAHAFGNKWYEKLFSIYIHFFLEMIWKDNNTVLEAKIPSKPDKSRNRKTRGQNEILVRLRYYSILSSAMTLKIISDIRVDIVCSPTVIMTIFCYLCTNSAQKSKSK